MSVLLVFFEILSECHYLRSHQRLQSSPSWVLRKFFWPPVMQRPAVTCVSMTILDCSPVLIYSYMTIRYTNSNATHSMIQGSSLAVRPIGNGFRSPKVPSDSTTGMILYINTFSGISYDCILHVRDCRKPFDRSARQDHEVGQDST